MRIVGALAVLAFLAFAAGCEESVASNMHIRLKGDGSGTIRTTRLSSPEKADGGGGGVTWATSAQVVTAVGTFSDLNQVSFEDATFATGKTPQGVCYLRVTLPRGPEARWPAAFTVPDAKRRAENIERVYTEAVGEAEAADETSLREQRRALRGSKIGSLIQVRIDLPGKVISHGVSARMIGVSASAEKETATLEVSPEVGLRPGEPITFDVTWRE